jgi:hypothetical protein
MMNHKRNVLLGLAAALLVAAAPGRSQAQCSGDPNGSGSITGTDVSIVLACINNPANAVCGTSCGGDGILDCADVNADGALTISDAVLIANEASAAPCPLNPVPICSSAGMPLPCDTVISADITANTTLGACEYELDGTIFVQPGVVVTIRPGATIKGRAVSGDGTPSALVFLQGDCASLGGDNQPAAGEDFSARINAVGTASQPIIFTSDQAVGEKASGQWAGVVFNGCSQTNVPGGVGSSEGFAVAVSFGGGGANDILDESSGVARYVRAEFAGRELAPNNELNVWTMNSLGSCTDFSFIQAHAGADDGFEWFGGTNNMRNVVATANRDDNFDWQLGSAIKVQFGVIQQTAGNVDTAGSNGFEGDNNETTNTLTPYSDPRICNITAIGDTTATGGTNLGMLLRRGTAGRIAKSIFHCWDDGGMRLDGTATAVHACDAPPSPFTLAFQTGPQLLVEASIFGENDSTAGNSPVDCGNNGSTGSECNSTDFCGLIQSTAAFPSGLDNTTRACSTNATISIPCAYGQIDPAPSVASEAANAFDCNSGFGGDPFFVSTNYAGAVDPNAPSWLDTPGGWINFDLN